MEWSQNLSVGVDEIDNQHKELINRVNKLHRAMKTEKKQEEILNILKFLEEYVIFHFHNEENLQLKYHYPLYLEHCEIHRNFIKVIKCIKKDIEVDGMNASTCILVSSTLSNWLINHICKADRDIGDYIRENFEI
jgi:hemerythrin